MLYRRLIRDAEDLTSRSLVDPPAADAWRREQPERRRQWLDMLGLDPLPERTPLEVTCTGTLERDSFVVEKLHYKVMPGCRIAANLYRPKKISSPLPAVLYVCGHAKRGKFNYQEHPRWFGRHGYVALIVDAIQIGENGGFHHGTYHEGWWHWYSQGYSPVAVEVWAAMRAADYLQSRPDVDPERLGITGNSGGGTVSWFAGAADPRFRVVVPSCQTGSVAQHVRDRTVDGHCDCTYWINTRRWDLPDLASLIAPRPLLIAAATEDGLFRPYAFHEVYQRARRLYAALGCEDNVDLVDAVTPHGYSPHTRLTIFNWFGRHLKGSDEPVTDDVDPENETDDTLAVYPDKKPPADDTLSAIDRTFIALPEPPRVASAPEWTAYRDAALRTLRQRTFGQIPSPVGTPRFESRRQGQSHSFRFITYEFESEPGLPLRVNVALPLNADGPVPILMGPMLPDQRSPFCAQGAGNQAVDPARAGFAAVEVRGTGCTSIGPGLEWTCRRAYPILGQTLYERRVLDMLCAAQVLRCNPNIGPIVAFGEGSMAAVALYSALLDEEMPELVLHNPVATHWDGGPEFLNVLQTGDLPHNAALLFPRRITFVGDMPETYAWTQEAYTACGQKHSVRTVASLKDWMPAGK
jgi:dienelactone hydrolase